MNPITLTWSEIMMGAMAGVMRNIQSDRSPRQRSYNLEAGHDWQTNIEGALAEMALAKQLNLYWAGKGMFKGADVANEEVRSTVHQGGCLRVGHKDHDDRRFWLMTGENGTYTNRGFILGKDAKAKQEYWGEKIKGRGFSYWIPQKYLTKLEDFNE